MSAQPEPHPLPFPPLTKQHILNCSYHAWHPRYRTLTPKSRVIRLSKEFIAYLRADSIILPPEPHASPEDGDASQPWAATHAKIQSTIAALDRRVTPKLNWSSPKDAAWISPTNTLECRSANEVYLLLKSSDFITHDLDHAFDGCVDAASSSSSSSSSTSVADDNDADGVDDIPWRLVLRKFVPGWNPAVEFRCFVRARRLLALSQRDPNHYPFLFDARPRILASVYAFFTRELRDTFPDESYVFDCYVPAPYARVWLVDVNPWAARTEGLLFEWRELLSMADPVCRAGDGEADDEAAVADVVNGHVCAANEESVSVSSSSSSDGSASVSEEEDEDEDEDDIPDIEFRLVAKSDSQAYAFNSSRYSAHQMPRDVVDASSGAYDAQQLRDFAEQWQELVKKGETRRGDESSDDDDDDDDGGGGIDDGAF